MTQSAMDKELKKKAKITSRLTVNEVSALIFEQEYENEESLPKEISDFRYEISRNFQKVNETEKKAKFGRYYRSIKGEKIFNTKLPISYYYSLFREGKLPSLKDKPTPKIFKFFEDEMLKKVYSISFMEHKNFPILSILEFALWVRRSLCPNQEEDEKEDGGKTQRLTKKEVRVKAEKWKRNKKLNERLIEGTINKVEPPKEPKKTTS